MSIDAVRVLGEAIEGAIDARDTIDGAGHGYILFSAHSTVAIMLLSSLFFSSSYD
jgi:hypothetical protein